MKGAVEFGLTRRQRCPADWGSIATKLQVLQQNCSDNFKTRRHDDLTYISGRVEEAQTALMRQQLGQIWKFMTEPVLMLCKLLQGEGAEAPDHKDVNMACEGLESRVLTSALVPTKATFLVALLGPEAEVFDNIISNFIRMRTSLQALLKKPDEITHSDVHLLFDPSMDDLFMSIRDIGCFEENPDALPRNTAMCCTQWDAKRGLGTDPREGCNCLIYEVSQKECSFGEKCHFAFERRKS